ncbi:hypothetical protein HaLaN_09418 [Haematococcus lacustris]|uniref:Uncharacterized protein n=1 Tax=Haematococcus lacustris TaxID=44745 RepID=A0A699Z229_HAELA|nr:hypothetical protein HaLaN_09418 [Haematococcus lacustris]
MGNVAAKERDVDRHGSSLDALGGYWRPAVSRENELNTKTAWLGAALAMQPPCPSLGPPFEPDQKYLLAATSSH